MKKIILTASLCGTLISFFVNVQHKRTLPSYFPEPFYRTDPGSGDSLQRELGRSLFYDPLLSADGSVSCASCHSSFHAFAHTDHALSHGIGDSIGIRNAPALFNLAWQKEFMWDGAVNHIDVQALAPITHPGEMGSDIGTVLQKLRSSRLYRPFFARVYGDTLISTERMLRALAAFQLSLISAGSRYDKMREGLVTFSGQEQRGYALFQQYCNSCHTEPLFSSYRFASNGLVPDPALNDAGRYRVTLRAGDSLLFKIPSLRNLSFSYPYMHDGRFRRLQQVLDHYSSGIMHSNTLAPELRGGLPLTAADKTDLIAFLLTLNDPDFVFDPAFGYPRHILGTGEGTPP